MEKKKIKIKESRLYFAITGPLKVSDDVIRLRMDEFKSGKYKECNIKKIGDEVILEFIIK